MSTSTISSVLDAIRAALVARGGLTGVQVFSAPVSYEEAGLECVAFGAGELTEIAATMGGNREETWRVDGEVRVEKGWQGTTEQTISAARGRAIEIFAELEAYLNDTYQGSLPDVDLVSARMEQSIGQVGRVCQILFTIEVEAIKNP